MHGLVFRFGPFQLIPSLGLLLEGDRPLHMGNRALTIIQILAERAGQVDAVAKLKAELTRERMVTVVGTGGIIAWSLDLVRSEGARGWELRAATSLALLYKRLDRHSEAYNVLEDILSHFTQGHDTRDVRTAVRLLSDPRQ